MRPTPVQAPHHDPSNFCETLEVTLILRPQNPLPDLHPPERDAPTSGPAVRVPHLTHAQLISSHGARPEDIDILHAFARKHDLHIKDVDVGRRTVRLSGRAETLREAFDTQRQQDAHPTSPPLPRPLPIASGMHEIVEAVLGLTPASVARRHRTSLRCPDGKRRTLRDLACAYAFPKGMDGQGQTIGLIELGGGFHVADIEQFCARNSLPMPRISTVEVHGGVNLPAPVRTIHEMLDCVDGDRHLSGNALRSSAIEAAQATVEVTMDLEILAALAPAAHLVVYFATPDEQGIYHALSSAIHDQHHHPDVLSISWGEPEVALSDDYLHAIDRLLLTACHLGITVCASSGDAGARNNSPDDMPAVNFPASSPHCLACGGTTSHFAGESGAVQVAQETAWNASHFGFKGATGGGVSRKFPLPAWQHKAGIPPGPTGLSGRGVPDVAGPADPRSGSEVQVAGRTFSSAGTSAVAPLWAALIACCNQALGHRCGHLNPHIYHIGHHGMAGLRPVTQGRNDFYEAGPGWNACAGYGTPAGVHLLEHLRLAFGSSRL